MSGRWRLPGGLTVQGWFNLVIVVLVALICVGGVSAGLSLKWTQTATDDLIDRLSPADAAASQLGASFLNQETGLRGYALSGDETALDPYNEGLQLQEQSASELRFLMDGRSDLVADLARIEDQAERWRAAFAAPILAVTPDAGARAVDPGVYERGRDAFDQLRGDLGELDRHLAQASADARTLLAHARTVRAVVFASLFAVLLLASVMVAVLIRKAVITPLRRVADSSRLVAEGNFDHRVEAGRGPADIRALAEDIEAMRARIVAELAVVRSRQELLETQTAQLDSQTAELRRSNAELEQFAYVASHDLQEPLRKVASFCQLLDKCYSDALDERGKQYIGFAVDGAKRMQVLINDLLAFSRVGRIGAGFDRLSLSPPLDKALSNLSTAIAESGARITRPDQLPTVDGDPTLLTMLWQNLVGNAVKFNGSDAGAQITITAQRGDDGMWLMCVQDNGIGISEEFAEKVFVIFQRLHGRDEYTGTGIGLAMCRKIVEYHGGRIWLDTSYRGGARFCFTLPSPDPTSPDQTALTLDADIRNEGALT
ncbi:ATP-binding protein (plasmid) [Prescottella equi]|uniref:sensor histidine kinase n=1 Tax=Rhodococcus hoagii TaxID=43767 RepID=UPI002578E94D|nr:sensor histidine kinase [Prescottella equi]WJJ14435.1 ATP-binding protein [Prescottella equi]